MTEQVILVVAIAVAAFITNLVVASTAFNDGNQKKDHKWYEFFW